jgi:anti-sigma-K factor RskA
MTHERYEDSAGAYLLGALPELERQAFEQHLERCEDCRQEVERLRPAVEMLPRAATALSPPPRLKVSLMEVVEREAREQAQVREETGRWRARLSRRISPPPRLGPAAAWVSAAVLLAVGAAGGLGLAGALDDDRSQTLAADVDEAQLPRATARLVVAEDGRTALLRTTGMPSLDEGAVYQVWLERDGEVISQSLFDVGPDGTGAGAVIETLDDADAVMITREPSGGSRVPTEKPIVAVEL